MLNWILSRARHALGDDAAVDLSYRTATNSLQLTGLSINLDVLVIP